MLSPQNLIWSKSSLNLWQRGRSRLAHHKTVARSSSHACLQYVCVCVCVVSVSVSPQEAQKCKQYFAQLQFYQNKHLKGFWRSWFFLYKHAHHVEVCDKTWTCFWSKVLTWNCPLFLWEPRRLVMILPWLEHPCYGWWSGSTLFSGGLMARRTALPWASHLHKERICSYRKQGRRVIVIMFPTFLDDFLVNCMKSNH